MSGAYMGTGADPYKRGIDSQEQPDSFDYDIRLKVAKFVSLLVALFALGILYGQLFKSFVHFLFCFFFSNALLVTAYSVSKDVVAQAKKLGLVLPQEGHLEHLVRHRLRPYLLVPTP
jgi:hypothetical protein